MFAIWRLRQRLAVVGVGFNGHIAPRKSLTPHVRFGSKADIRARPTYSALPPKADIRYRDRRVRFVPGTDIARVFRESLDAACPFSWT